MRVHQSTGIPNTAPSATIQPGRNRTRAIPPPPNLGDEVMLYGFASAQYYEMARYYKGLGYIPRNFMDIDVEASPDLIASNTKFSGGTKRLCKIGILNVYQENLRRFPLGLPLIQLHFCLAAEGASPFTPDFASILSPLHSRNHYTGISDAELRTIYKICFELPLCAQGAVAQRLDKVAVQTFVFKKFDGQDFVTIANPMESWASSWAARRQQNQKIPYQDRPCSEQPAWVRRLVAYAAS